ncbi:hypothetical protein [uncultured Maribacter sp.]|uniref:hypothetical protein n=1 Tax=uncultured Maribacter sp. TaxID=431308 RepID=UPI002632A93B|nr:hypothetical protein [uncultured Maribacter sp.]
MKQNKFLSMLFVMSLLFVACEEQEELNLTDVNHRVIVTSEQDFANTINVGGDIDLGDISRGVESRTWTLPINGSIISGGTGQTSSENVIKAVFNKAGVYDVVLNQKFKGNVFRNEDSTTPSDTRELDTTIVVTVIDSITSVLKAHRINPDGSIGAEINLADDAEHELEASNSIRLSYTAIGEPQNINWSSEGGKPKLINQKDTEDFVDMRFNKLGSWDLQYIADRFRPTDADTLFFENVIKVIPSPAPVTLDRVAEREGKINLEFSREIDDATVNAANFTVRIENNTDEMNPIVLNPTVSLASVDNDEATIVILEIDGAQIYNDDQVYISYTPGVLSTVDGKESEAITDALLTDFTPLTNIYPETEYDYGFEVRNVEDFPFLGWQGPWGDFDLAIEFDKVRSGAKSLKVSLRPNGGMIVQQNSGGSAVTFTLKAGTTYEFGYWMYIESDLTALPTDTQSADIQVYPSDWGGPNLAPTTFTSDMATGEWVYHKQVFTNGGPDREVTWLLRGFNEFHDNALVFYWDDFFLAEVPVRPTP